MPRKRPQKKAKKRYRPNPIRPKRPDLTEAEKAELTKEIKKKRRNPPNFREGFDAGRHAGDVLLAHMLIGGLFAFLGIMAGAPGPGPYPRQPAPPPDAPQIDAPNVVNLKKKEDGTYGE